MWLILSQIWIENSLTILIKMREKFLLVQMMRTIVYRSTWLGNTIIIFVIQQICSNKAHLDLTMHNAVMLIKFSKQIANTFAKIINSYKGEFKTLSNIWNGTFSAKSLLASEANSECWQTTKMEFFAKNSQRLKAVHYLCKNLYLGYLTRFWICFWIGFQS